MRVDHPRPFIGHSESLAGIIRDRWGQSKIKSAF